MIELLDRLGVELPDDRHSLFLSVQQVIDELPITELHPATFWDCENCGTENFVRSLAVRMENEDRETVGMWYTTPTRVTCRKCGFEYLVKRNIPE